MHIIRTLNGYYYIDIWYMQRLMVAIVSLLLRIRISSNDSTLFLIIQTLCHSESLFFLSLNKCWTSYHWLEIIIQIMLKSSRTECSLKYRSISLSPSLTHNFFCFNFLNSPKCLFLHLYGYLNRTFIWIRCNYLKNWRFILKSQFRYYLNSLL